MHRPTITIILSTGIVFVALSLLGLLDEVHLPGNNQGYSPPQPIRYSHRLHAGELEMPCLYCHFGAERSRHAGIPPVSVCMNCHKFVTAPITEVRAEDKKAAEEARPPKRVVSSELRKLYDAVGLGDDLKPDPARKSHSIEWVQVHRLPDFVYFDHRRHVNADVACQRCHGPIEMTERVSQFASLSMGWCVECHRNENAGSTPLNPVHASIDCAGCHY